MGGNRCAGILLFTYSHLSLFLGEVGGDVFEGGRCTGPEGEVTLSELALLRDEATPASSQLAVFLSYLRILMASSLSGLKNSKFS